MSSKPTASCRGCGRVLEVPYVYTHERKVHGLYGGRTGAVRRRRAVRADDKALIPMPAVKSEPAPPNITVLEDFQVVTDGKRIGVLQWLER